MATTQSISPLYSPQTLRRSRVTRLPRIDAQDLRDLAAAEAQIASWPKDARSAKKAVQR